jgi:hypothetical protein
VQTRGAGRHTSPVGGRETIDGGVGWALAGRGRTGTQDDAGARDGSHAIASLPRPSAHARNGPGQLGSNALRQACAPQGSRRRAGHVTAAQARDRRSGERASRHAIALLHSLFFAYAAPGARHGPPRAIEAACTAALLLAAQPVRVRVLRPGGLVV